MGENGRIPDYVCAAFVDVFVCVRQMLNSIRATCIKVNGSCAGNQMDRARGFD